MYLNHPPKFKYRMQTIAAAVFASMLATVLVLVYVYQSRIAYEAAHMRTRLPRMLAAEYVPRSGDVVFMKFSYGRPFIDFALDGFFHHVGIMLDDGGSPVLLESLPPHPWRPFEGIVLRPWAEVLASNVLLYVMPINKPLDATRNEKLLALAERGYKYPSHPELIKRFLTAQATDPESDSAHCYDVAAMALETIGFMDLLDKSMAEKSKAIECLYGKELPDGYIFLHPIEIVVV